MSIAVVGENCTHLEEYLINTTQFWLNQQKRLFYAIKDGFSRSYHQ